jgi:hypothetical protein
VETQPAEENAYAVAAPIAGVQYANLPDPTAPDTDINSTAPPDQHPPALPPPPLQQPRQPQPRQQQQRAATDDFARVQMNSNPEYAALPGTNKESPYAVAETVVRATANRRGGGQAETNPQYANLSPGFNGAGAGAARAGAGADDFARVPMDSNPDYASPESLMHGGGGGGGDLRDEDFC